MDYKTKARLTIDNLKTEIARMHTIKDELDDILQQDYIDTMQSAITEMQSAIYTLEDAPCNTK